MSKTAVIFGVTGQDGSYLAEYLLGLDYKVVGVTRRCSVDNTINIKPILEGGSSAFKLIEGDVSDYLSVSGCLMGAREFFNGYPDEVYNLAAQSHVGLSFQQPTSSFRITAEGPLNILSAIQKEGLPSHTRFYQASSSELYGNAPAPQNEQTAFAPNSPYAIAKLSAHHTVRMFREAYGMYACSGVLNNHESPRRGNNFVTKKITNYVRMVGDWMNKNPGMEPMVIQRIQLGTNIEVPRLKLGNLNACRDWGYAKDYVEAMHLMLQQNNPSDYVIGTGQTHTIRDFLDLAFQEIGIKDWTPYVEIDPALFRPSEVNYLLADASKAKAELGWEPKTSLAELVKIMVNA